MKIKNSDVIKLIRAGKYEEATFELLKAMEPTGILTDDPKKIWELLRKYATKKQEHFIVVLLDNKNVVIEHKVVSIGTLTECMIHPRDIFREAIDKSCAGIIIAHNHPSDNINPSKEDINLTNRLIEGGKLLGITVLDHVIITKKSFLSLREANHCKF